MTLGAALTLLATACPKPQTFEEGMREACSLPEQIGLDGGADDVQKLVVAYKARVTNVGVRAMLDDLTPRGHDERDAMIAEALRIAGIGPCWMRAPDAGP